MPAPAPQSWTRARIQPDQPASAESRPARPSPRTRRPSPLARSWFASRFRDAFIPDLAASLGRLAYILRSPARVAQAAAADAVPARHLFIATSSRIAPNWTICAPAQSSVVEDQ